MTARTRSTLDLPPKTLICTAVSLALASMATPSLAAEEEGQKPAPQGEARTLPKISVEGEEVTEYRVERPASPKYTAQLRDIPQTVVVIPKAVFTEQGATTLSQALRNTPGITFLAGEGGGASSTAGDSFFMRGFDATNSVFIDSVRDQGAYSRDVFNLEQIEVAKGPSGSYSGRGNAAGSVNLVTKTPHEDAAQAGTVAYGTNEHKRATIDINQPLALGPEGTAIRLNALWQDGGVAGRDEVERDSWGFAPSVAFGLGTATRITLAAQIVRQDNTPDYGLPIVALLGESVAGVPIGDVDQTNFYGQSDLDFEDIDSDSYTASLSHDFGDNLTLSNQTRYSENSRLAVITTVQNLAAFNPITGQVTRARQSNERENDNFTNQTNLRVNFRTGAFVHTLSTGLEFTREKQFNPVRTGAGTAVPADLYNPDPHHAVTGYAPDRVPGDFTEGETQTEALYAFDTMELNEHWQLNAGLRVESYDTDFFDSTPAANVPATLAVSDTLTSWNLGVVYKPVEAGSIYVSAATTRTPPGGANFQLSATENNANNPAVAPQESVNYEIGTKWDLLDARLAMTAALFRAENSNEITTNASTGEVLFDSKRRVEGLEFGLVGQITERWQTFAGFSYLDSEFVKSANTTQQGATLQWTPKLSGNLWTTYELPRGFSIGGGVQYLDTVARSVTNAPGAPTTVPEAPSYWLYNATAAWQANTHVSVRLNLNNLADEAYIASLNNNGGRYNPGAERSYLLSADITF